MNDFVVTEKEKVLFDRCVKDKELRDKGMQLYCLIKRNKLRRALEIGTGDWFYTLCMGLGGAWVVSLSNRVTSPAHYGILNSYQDRVFQIQDSPKNYLSEHHKPWDVIFLNESEYKVKDYNIFIKHFTSYLVISSTNGLEVIPYEKT